jgi:transposase
MVSENPNSSFVLQPQLNEETGEVINSLVKPYGIGIDCHSKFYQVCILIKKKQELDEAVFRYEFDFKSHHKNIREGLEKCIDVLLHNGVSVTYEDLHYTCESTGPYHRPLILVWKGAPCIVNPVLATPSRRKTDVLDARLLAHYDITGLFPKSYIQNEPTQANKTLLSYYQKLKKTSTQSTNKIVNILTYFGNTIASRSNIKNAGIRPYIEDLCTSKILNEDMFFQVPPDDVCFMILELYKAYDEAQEKAKSVHKLIFNNIQNQVFENDFGTIKGAELIKLLMSCPGIGEFTACIFLIEIGNIYRFPTPKALAAYCGFDPSLKVSAGKTTSHTVRKGNKYLHSTLMRSAGVVLNKKNEPLGKWGYTISAKSPKGGYKKASGAIARRIVTGMFFMWRRNERFSTDKYMFTDFREVENIIIEKLDLSNRTKNILKSLEIKDSSTLLHYYKNALLIRKGIGSKTIQEIDLCLKSLTLTTKKKQMNLTDSV